MEGVLRDQKFYRHPLSGRRDRTVWGRKRRWSWARKMGRQSMTGDWPERKERSEKPRVF